MNSIIWFHVECPRMASKFDDPVEFKRKFRDYFASYKAAHESHNRPTKRHKDLTEEFYIESGYPEDIKLNKKADKYKEMLKQYSYWNGGEDFEDTVPDRFKRLEHEVEP